MLIYFISPTVLTNGKFTTVLSLQSRESLTFFFLLKYGFSLFLLSSTCSIFIPARQSNHLYFPSPLDTCKYLDFSLLDFSFSQGVDLMASWKDLRLESNRSVSIGILNKNVAFF